MIPLSNIIRATLLVAAWLFGSSLLVEFIWNSQLIEFLNVQKIDYKQALAIQILCFLLFGRNSMFNVINVIESIEGKK